MLVIRAISLLGILLSCAPLAVAAATVSGELRMWHKVTLDFAGPATSETADPNPFTDYRLDVTFTHPQSGKTHIVPGYYAADGDAANTGASSGNRWRVHFAPDRIGSWTYTASFRSGPNVATDPNAGSSAGFFDGDAGGFEVAPTDKTGRDFRGKGRLEYVGKHHLRFAGTGEFFMKAGCDAPENFLAYADFDGDFKTDGHFDHLVKTWSPHTADWQPGDPVWQGDKGKGIIGAINYLASEELNAFSFLTFNIIGDDRNVFLYTTYSERTRLDVSRLDQWEIVFEHGTRKGMYLHFKTQEKENQTLLDGGDLGPLRKLYYRELIARFGHHLALNWNLGEECTVDFDQKQSWAQYFHDIDPYDHLIVIHNGSNHRNLMGTASEVTGFSLQRSNADFSDTFIGTKDYVDRSFNSGKPWVVACDEPGDSQYSLRPDSNPGNSHVDARRDALWGNIMAGGAGCEFYFGYALEHSDLTCQDFRSRDSFWDYCRHALAIFRDQNFPIELMKNQNALVSGSGENANRCRALSGHSYLVQLRSGGSHTLDLTGFADTFSVKWLDPRQGGAAIAAPPLAGGGIVSLGPPPHSPTDDWIVLLQSTTAANPTNLPPQVDAGPDRSEILVDATLELAFDASVTDDGLPADLTLTRSWSFVSGPAPVAFSSTTTAATTATFTTTGTYLLRLAASDGDLSAFDEVAVVVAAPPDGGQTFPPVHDAFTDSGENDNGPLLRVAPASRIAYLRFDLTTLTVDPATAILRLTEGAGLSAGNVLIRLHAAQSNDWTEQTLDATNAPAKGIELAVFSGGLAPGQTVEFDLADHLADPGLHGFILEADPATDEVAFASKEHATPAARPQLVVTLPPNAPPTFVGFTLATSVNRPVTLPFAQILATASDPDGDPLSLLPTPGDTAAGGDIAFGPDSLTYTPVIDQPGPDSFPLTVSDGRGGLTTGTLSLEVSVSDGIEGRVPSLARLPGGAVTLHFQGVPHFQYAIQRSVDLAGWTTLSTLGGAASGTLDFTDPAPPDGKAFFRVAVP
jgi:hypothetical protein